MAKLRRNHGSSERNSSFGASLMRLTIILLLFLVAIFIFFPKIKAVFESLGTNPEVEQNRVEPHKSSKKRKSRLYLPTGPSDQVVHHTHYSLGYEEDWEQPRWVAYSLTKKQVRSRNAKRSDDFKPDPLVKTKSAVRQDYKRSGYSRGHLVPAGDMAFSRTAMDETFYYSNMSPQTRAYNGGVWRELEETVRDWAVKYKKIYIVSGPIKGNSNKYIGRNDVLVPEAYYKVILNEKGAGIGFIIPHEKQTKHLRDFAVSIDEVEKATNLDFFPELETLSPPQTERKFDLGKWPFQERRFKTRVSRWNNR